MTTKRADALAFYIPPRKRREFDELMEKVMGETNRTRSTIIVEVLTKCLEKMAKDGARKTISVKFNL